MIEFDDDFIDDDSDDDDDLDECGMLEGGQCYLAGTEYCDFECPIGRQPRTEGETDGPSNKKGNHRAE